MYIPHCWDWAADLGYTKEETRESWKIIENHEFFWSALGELPGARHLKMLDESEHDVYFVTTRSCGIKVKQQTERWLKARGVQNPTVLISESKGLIAKGLKLDVFIDDNLENCNDIAATSTKTRVYILDYPYNHKRAERATRVQSVTEMLTREKLLVEVEVG